MYRDFSCKTAVIFGRDDPVRGGARRPRDPSAVTGHLSPSDQGTPSALLLGMKQTVQQRDTAAAKEAAGESLTASILADMEMQDLGPDAREVELLARAAAADRIAQEAVGRSSNSRPI